MWMKFINARALWGLILFLTLSNAESEKRKPGPRHYKDNPVWDQSLMFKGPRKQIEATNDMPERTKTRRLLKLAKSHDVNGDGNLQFEEMSEWILESYSIWDYQDVRDTMMRMDGNQNNKVSISEFIVDRQEGKTEKDASKLKKKREKGNKLSKEEEDFLRAFDENQQRFATADLNKDGSLDEEELALIVHPAEHPTMATLEMKFSMDFGDINKDGVISTNEFVNEDAPLEQRKEAEEKFHELDEDKDGVLSLDEMRIYIAPTNDDAYEKEVNNLIEKADKNKDEQLSMDEIQSGDGDFLFSPITDFSRNLFFIKDDKRLEEEDRKIEAKLRDDLGNKAAGEKSSESDMGVIPDEKEPNEEQNKSQTEDKSEKKSKQKKQDGKKKSSGKEKTKQKDKPKAKDTKKESKGADKASKKDKDKKNKKDEL